MLKIFISVFFGYLFVYGAEQDPSLYTISDLTCSNSSGLAQRRLIAFNSQGLQFDGETFSVSGFLVDTSQPLMFGDRKTEKKLDAKNEINIDFETSLSMESCRVNRSAFRSLGSRSNYSPEEYAEIVPGHAKCVTTRFYDCGDQRQTYDSALTRAEEGQKTLLLVFGWESCPWCSNMLDYLSTNEDIQEKFEIQTIGTLRANRTWQPLLRDLNSKSLNPLEKGQKGFPILVVQDPTSGEIQMLQPESLEDNSGGKKSYHFDQVFATLMQLQNR